MILKITENRSEGNNCFSLILEKPQGCNFYPGQYLDVELPVKDPLSSTRAFTIASSPTEDFLMITTRKGLSKFKKVLEKLKAGDTITTSHPAGTFTLDESSPAIFIAGGIGITPFRSIIKYAMDFQLATSITLIYSNSDKNFLFKQELDKWQDNLTNLKIIYHPTSESGRLNKKSFQLYPLPLTLYPTFPAQPERQALLIFYLAGPPKMVDDCAKILLQLGVDETNIRYDRFDGY